jgi:hypothetical protein
MVSTKKQKSFNAELDNLLTDLDLPSEQEIKEETRCEKIRQTSADRWKDPDYNERVSAKIAQVFSSEEMREVQAAKFRGATVSEEVKQRLKEHNTGKDRKGQNWIAGMAEKKRGNNCRSRPLVTPQGVFVSKKIAAEFYLENNLTTRTTLVSCICWVDYQIKHFQSKFYFISREEYIMLTGKEI